MGWTEEEQKAHTVLAEGPFNKDSNKIWTRDENGDVYFVDTRFLDTYEYIKRPVTIALNRINQGVLQGDDLDEFMFKAITDSAESLLEPFASPEMISEAIYTTTNRWRKGYVDTGEAFGEILSTFVPGSATSIYKLLQAEGNMFETPNKYTGEAKNAQKELFANLTGGRFTKYDPDTALTLAVKDYNRISKSQNIGKFLFNSDIDEYADDYDKQQQELYNAQQDLFRVTSSYVTLYGRRDAMKKMRRGGLSRSL